MSERLRVLRKETEANQHAARPSLLAARQTRYEVAADVESTLRAGGQALDAESRFVFEPRFGHDFSQVRVHTDAEAAESAAALGANAYAIGQDIVFGAGHYEPATAEGRALLAHELTHVVQHDREDGGSPTPGELSVSDGSDGAEQEADRVGRQAVAGSAVQVHAMPAAEVAREEDEKKNEDPISGPLGAISEIVALVGEATGHEGLKAFAEGSKAGSGAGGAIASPGFLNVGGAISGIGELLGVPGAGLASSAIGTVSGAQEGLEAKSLEGNILGGLKAVQGMGALTAGIGGFSMSTAGGLAVSALPEAASAGALGTTGLLGPAAAVMGAGIAGYEAGKGLDKLSNWIGHQVSDNKAADYSLSGMSADWMVGKDQEFTEGMRYLGLFDKSKPAYTQTIGWRLANLFE
jgi:hypothetical protein